MITRPLNPEEWISYLVAGFLSWSILVLLGVLLNRIQTLPMVIRILIWGYLLVGGVVGTLLLGYSASTAMQREPFIHSIFHGVSFGIQLFMMGALVWPILLYWTTSRW